MAQAIELLGYGNDLVEASKAGGIILPEFSASDPLKDFTEQEGAAIGVNYPNIVDGLSKIGIRHPMSSTLDIGSFGMGLKVNKKGRSQMRLQFTPEDIIKADDLSKYSSQFWLGYLVAEKELKRPERKLSLREDGGIILPAIGILSVGEFVLGLATLHGNTLMSEIIMGTAATCGAAAGGAGIWYTRQKNKLNKSPSQRVTNSRRLIAHSKRLAVTHPVFEHVDSELSLDS